MECKVLLFDYQVLDMQSQEISQLLADFEKETFAFAGQDFNLSSPKHLQEIVFDKLNVRLI
ncbi:hypothetical protein, partial [Proteus mirabilis]|uniref:hypothetical protein n=1 Tax=Proteus mirabilis TaxID=584 RepID=UPI00313B3158